LIATHKQQQNNQQQKMSSSSYTNPNTTVTALSSNPYRDVNAGGIWGCGNVRGWGSYPGVNWNQFCASCPPCTVNRFPTRLITRDNKYGCCNSEKYLFQPSWPWLYSGNLTGNINGNLSGNLSGSHIGKEYEPLWKELWDQPINY